METPEGGEKMKIDMRLEKGRNTKQKQNMVQQTPQNSVSQIGTELNTEIWEWMKDHRIVIASQVQSNFIMIMCAEENSIEKKLKNEKVHYFLP